MAMPLLLTVLVAGILAGFFIGYQTHKSLETKNRAASSRAGKSRRSDAESEAKSIIREAEIQARSEVLKAREAFENSVKEQRRVLDHTMSSLHQRESALSQREDNLDRKAEVLDKKQDAIEKKATAAENALLEARQHVEEAAKATALAETRLQKLAAMTRDQARETLLESARKDIEGDLATFLLREKDRVEKQASKHAQKALVSAMERYAASHASEYMTRTVLLPSEEIKGRIIGREGRNIRALEQATGCSFLMDDAPESVVLSCADPVRREVAANALKALIAGGRFHPQIIEDVVANEQNRLEQVCTEYGQQAAAKVDVNLASVQEATALGRLFFRTSFTQNVLQHSIEVAAYAGLLASEIGLDAELARLCGLLHDIGKSLDESAHGPHALLGGDFVRKCGETQEVVDAVAGHHRETDSVSLYAALISIADTLSAARPGARNQSEERYLNRIEKIEKIAISFPGVTRAFAIQAGRDLRVLVDPEKTSDKDALLLAQELCRKLEAELSFPGQIRVTVVRDFRCTEYAH